jgi:hypothetical protein
MTDLDERELGVDAILRASGPRLRAAMSQAPVVEFRRPRSGRRRGWLIAVATVVVLILGLVAIGTNRNDLTPGSDPSRLYWLLTDLPDGLELVQMSEPGSQTGPPGATTMLNVYATDAAPLGPILSISGSIGRGLEVQPAAGGVNFRETTIGDRRAAFADAESGTRLLYLEVDGHWVVMTSRNIDDTALSRMAQAVVRDANGIAKVPVEALQEGLTLVLSDDAPNADLGVGSDFSGISYAHPDGRSMSLAVYPTRPSSRAMLGLQTQLTATTVRGASGFAGSYATDSSVPQLDVQLLSWERDGLDFRVTGFNVTAAEVMAAAESARSASDEEWNELLRQTGGGQDSAAADGTVPAEPAPPGTDPPFRGEVRDVAVEVSVVDASANEQVWTGTLPTGEAWKVDVTRVFDSLALRSEVDELDQGVSVGPLPRNAGEEFSCCGPLNIVTADPAAAGMRVTTHDGDRFVIPLHDLPGTDGLRIALVPLADGGPQLAELLDGEGNVLEAMPGGS